jgi:hypothetical protein
MPNEEKMSTDERRKYLGLIKKQFPGQQGRTGELAG